MARITAKTVQRANARADFEKLKAAATKAKADYQSETDIVKRAKKYATYIELTHKQQTAGRIMRGKRS